MTGRAMLQLLVILAVISAAWYVLIVRPQREQQGTHERLVGQLSVGAHVMTVGGIYGRVQAIEGATVVIELAPGMVTRVAVDGIARIVQGGEAPLPETASATANPHQDEQQQMNGNHPHHQHPHDTQQHAPQPSYVPPQVTQPGPYTFRAGVAAQPPVPPQPVQQQWAIPAAPMLALQPRQPFGQAVQPVATHAQPVQQPYGYVVQQHQPVPVQHVEPVAPQRRASSAPQGMGSSIRLDDPQIADMMSRAREERAELADEYRRVTSPLVVDGGHAPRAEATMHVPAQAHVPAQHAQPQPAAQPGQLFVHAPSPHAAPAMQYPQPAHVPPVEQVFDAGMPRPGIAPSHHVPNAFQQHSPFAPQMTGSTASA